MMLLQLRGSLAACVREHMDDEALSRCGPDEAIVELEARTVAEALSLVGPQAPGFALRWDLGNWRVSVDGRALESAAGLYYRRLEPEDAGFVWRCCRRRSPRPSLEVCRRLLSEQLEVDERAKYLAPPSAAGGVRRLVAVFNRKPAVIVTAEFPARGGGRPVLSVDPLGEDLAGNCARDALVWLAQAGYEDAEVRIYWPKPRGLETFVGLPLPEAVGVRPTSDGRVVTFVVEPAAP